MAELVQKYALADPVGLLAFIVFFALVLWPEHESNYRPKKVDKRRRP